MSRVLGAAVAVTLLLLACRSDRITTTDPSLALPTYAWSGGTAVIASPAFTGADTLPTVTMGADTLPVHWLGDASVRVQLPDTNGTIYLTVRLKSGGRTSAPIRVRGFAGVRDGPPLDVNGQITPWPGNGNPTALGFEGGQLVLVNLQSLVVSAPLAPDTGLWCHNHPELRAQVGVAPVPSATVPGLVTVVGACPRGEVLAVSLGAAPPDTGPVPPMGVEVAVHLRRGVWLVAGQNVGFQVFTRQDSGGFAASPWNGWEASGAVVSPRGDRVVPTFGYTGDPPGPPVYDPVTATAAYHLDDFRAASGPAAFSPGGDTLYADGVREDTSYIDNHELLDAIDARSGAVLVRTVLADSVNPYQTIAMGMAADPLSDLLYVFEWQGAPTLLALDRSTLNVVATLRAPAAVAGSLNAGRIWQGQPAAMVLDPIGRRLYVVPRTVWSVTAPPYVFAYDLMP